MRKMHPLFVAFSGTTKKAESFKRKNFLSKIRAAVFVCTLLVLHVVGYCQVNFTTSAAVIENFNSFTGDAAPTNWDIKGTGSRGTTWNGNAQTTGTSGGWYGNANMSFLGSSSASAGNATWILRNQTGKTLNAFSLSFLATMFKSNTSASPNVTVTYSVSSSATVPAAGALTNSLSSLTFSDATANISSGTTLSQTVTGANIPNNNYIFIRFIHAGGSNSDNLGWDNVTFTPLPVVAISNTTVAASNVAQGTTNVVLQQFSLNLTSSVFDATLNGLTVTTAGTYAAADLVNLKVRYSADNTLDASDATLSTKTASLGAGSQAFTTFTSQNITLGTTGYVFVTADFASNATVGRTINIATTAFSNISFTSVAKTGTDPVAVGGAKTIVASTTAPVLSTPTVTVTGTSSATLGATITSNGGAAITERGTVWGTTTSPTGNSLAEGGTSVSAFTHSRTGFTANTQYYFRGYAVNNVNTAYSASGTFTTWPNAPTALTATGATESGFTAHWSAPTGQGNAAYTYTLDRADNSGFTANLVMGANIASSKTDSLFTGLNAQQQYFYRIKAVNAGGSGEYSNTVSIYTLSASPLTAAGNFAATTTGTNSINLTWDVAAYPSSGATEKGYIILRRQSSNPTTNNVTDGVAPASLSLPLGTSLLTVINDDATTSYSNTGLSSGITYGYIIIPFTWDGVNEATYNYYTSDAVADDATTDTNIDNPASFTATAASTAQMDILVSANAAGNSVVVVYNTNGSFSVPTAGVAAGGVGASFAGGTVIYQGVAGNFAHTSLNTATHYYYKVFAYDAGNNFSSGLETDAYTLTDAPVAIAATVITNTGFTANWQTVSGAGGYLLDVAADNAFTSFIGSYQNLAVTGTSLSVSGLTPGATYYYRLRAENANAATSAYSNTITVTLLAYEPTVQATGLAFSAITTSSATVGWTAATTAPAGYIVVRRIAANPDAPVDGTTYTAGDLLGNSTIVFVGNAVSFNEVSLTAATQYRYSVYPYNGTGAAINYLTTTPLSGTMYTLAQEPGSHPAAFTATVNTATSVTLNFSAASTITNAAGYLILKKTNTPVSNLPVDGIAYSVGQELGVDTVAARITDINATSQSVTVMSGATTYFTIIPFNGDGSNAGTYNYYTNPTPATTSSITPSALSDIRAITGSEAATISSVLNTGTIANNTDGSQVWQFNIRDGASTGDSDALPTVINGLIFTQSAGNAINSFSNAIQSIALFNGTTLISNTATITATQIQFSGLNINVPDNDSITISLRLSVKANVNGGITTSSTANNIDGDDFGFTLTAANVTTAGVATSSQLSSFTSQSSTNGLNVYNVIASKLEFVQQPSNVQTGSSITPAVTVRGVDAGGNLDLAITTVSLTSNGATLSSGGSASTSSGVATFSAIQFSTSGTGITLVASINSGAVTVTSSTFNVTEAPVVVYKHTFGTSSPTSQPYTTAPDVFATNLNTSSWTGSSAFTGSAGNGGSGSGALSMTPGTATRTFTLTFNVATGYALAVTGFDFWRVSSSSGPDSWTLSINGTQVGSGSIPTTGALLGQTSVSAERSGLTGVITVVYTVSGGSGGAGTTRLDDFTLYGNVTSLCTAGSWTGATNTNPTTAGNWCNSTLPGTSTNVTISSGLTNYPVIATGQTLNVHNLTIASGASLTVTGTLNLAGGISNSGTLTASAGTVQFSGSAAQNIPANVFTGNTVKNLTINNSAGVSLQGTLNITGVLTPTGGTFNTGGYLTLKSGSIANTALVGIKGSSAAISGNVTVERFVPQSHRALRDIAPGVNTTQTFFDSWQEGGNNSTVYGTHITGKKGAVGVIDPATGFDLTVSGNPSLYSYDINSAGAAAWVTKTSTNQPGDVLQVLKAYRITLRGNRTHNLAADVAAMSAPVILRNTGTLVTGDLLINTTGVSGAVNTTAVKLNSASASGFTLIGNPYVAPLNWESVQASSSDIDPAYWVWDANMGTTGSYVTYSTATGLTSNVASNVNQYIQPGQGFFVRNAGNNPELVISESHKAINTTLTSVFKSANTSYPNMRVNLLKLSGTDTVNMDGAAVAFDNSFTNAVVTEDAGKITNPGENIAFVTNAKTLSVEARALPTLTDTLMLRVWTMTAGVTYGLRINLTQFNESAGQPYLKDLFTNTTTMLVKGAINNYSFTISSNAASYNDRFKIFFTNSTLPVRFVNVKAVPKNRDVNITWTAAETDAHTYTIEHSNNTVSWNVLQTIAAKGNGTQTYSYVHANAGQSVHYYRILSVDKSGSKQYSNTVSVNMLAGGNAIQVYPNPVQDGVVQLFIHHLPAATYKLMLFNAAGMQVHTSAIQHLQNGTMYPIQLQQLPAGTYTLSLVSDKTAQNLVVYIP